MSEVATARLTFGTAAALFQSPQAAEEAAALLVRQGYPRELITILTGQPWDETRPNETGLLPDPELGVQLTPASPHDVPSIKRGEELPPSLAAFAGDILTAQTRHRN